MEEGGIRNYQVNYAINATGDAAQFFQTMADNANALTEPLKALQAQVGQVNTALTSVRDMLKSALVLDLTKLNEGLKTAEETVANSAAKMAKSLEKALGKGATINTGQMAGQAKKSAQEMVTSLRSEMDQIVKDFDNTKGKLIKKSLKDLDDKGRMAVTKNMLKGDEQLTSLYDRYVELNKQMVKAQKTIAKPSKTATAIIDMAADFKTLNLTADAIRNLNGAVREFNNRKAVKVNINADATKAIGVLNEFLTKARESVAVVPLSAKAPEVVKGRGTTAQRGAGKENEQTIYIETKLNSENLATQLTTAMEKLQEKAMAQPVKVAPIVDATLATEQLTESITKLQEIAKTKSIDLKIAGASKHKALSQTASALKRYNEAAEKFNSRKEIKLKINADTSKAATAYDDFIAKVKATVATIPLSAQPVEAVKKSGKGVVTPVSETVANAVKGKERLAEIQAKLSGGELVGQLTKAINELQKLANDKPVAIKAIFSLDKAGYQMHQAINGLQKIADGKPIVLKATTSAPTVPNNGTATSNAAAAAVQSANTAIATVGKNGKGSVQVNTGGWADPTPAQVRAYERHNQQLSDLRISNAVDLIKQKEKFDKIAKVNNQAMYEQLFGREAMHRLWEERDKAGLSTRAKNKTAREFANRFSKPEYIQAYEQHEREMAQSQLSKEIDLLKQRVKGVAAKYAENEKMYQQLFGREAMHNLWEERDKAGLSTRAKNKAAREFANRFTKPEYIRAYEQHVKELSDLRLSNAMDMIKRKAKTTAATHVANEALYNQLFSRESLHNLWVERDKAGLSTRAKNTQNRLERVGIANIEAARFDAINSRYNKQELARIKSMVPPTPPTPPVPPTPTGYSGDRRYTAKLTQPKTDFNSRAKAFWYPLTGNTSFGARTPMAVEMAKGMGTMFAMGGAMSAVGSSLNQAVEYQNVMKTTNAILKNGTDNYTNGAFKNMEQIVRQVGKETKFTAPEVAHAAKFLAMAGYDIPAINAAIKPVSNIALIGDTNLGETADKLTNVMTTFGIEPEKMSDIADIMTTTFTRSNTDMMMLAESAKYAGGIAHLYGGSFKNNFADVMAMFGVMGNAGIQASSAGTTLRMMYQNLMQPNKNQKATLQKYGISARDAYGKPLEMIDILKQIAAKVPKGELADAVGNMFRITAQPGAAALATHLDGRNGLIALMEANRNAAGTGIAESIANEKKNTMSGLMAQVSSTFTEGVLQAFEGKEGGWAGMLAQLRDYLAQPETVEMLKSVVGLVEDLAKVVGQFAKVYAKVYDMFPGIINGWMKFQLMMTQAGYLATPLIQLASVMNMLKTAIAGTTAATATAVIAEKTVGNERKASAATNVAANMLSGKVLPTTSKGGNGLVAANIAASMAAYQHFKPYHEIKNFTKRPDISGPLSLVRNRWAYNNVDQVYDADIANRVGQYERGRIIRRDSPKYEVKQLNDTLKRKIAELNGMKRGGHIAYASGIPLTFGIGNMPVFQHGRQLVNGVYRRGAAMNVLPFHKYSGGAAATLQGGDKTLSNAAKYRLYAQKWGAISAYQNIPAAKRAMAAQKAEQYIEAAIWASQAEIKEKAEAVIANRNRINDIAGKRHAARGYVGLDVASRYARTAGWKKGAGFVLKNGWAAGMAAGTFKISGIAASIKSTMYSLLGGLAKAVGMLASPVGIATIALAGLAAAAYGVHKSYQQYKKNVKLAEDNQKLINKHQKTIRDSYNAIGNETYGIKPVNMQIEKPSVAKNASVGLLDKNQTVNDLLNKESVSGLSGRYIADKYVSNFKYLPENYVTDYYKKYRDPEVRGFYSSTLGTAATVPSNAEVQGSAIKLGVVTQWAKMATEQEEVKKSLAEVQMALKNKDFNLAQRIVESYKPISNMSMMSVGDAKAISQIQDPKRYYEWQYAQYKVLKDSLSAETFASKYSHALDLIENFKDFEKQRNQTIADNKRNGIDSVPAKFDGTQLAQTLIQSLPIAINGTTASLTLDKMGRVDWLALANSVNDKIPFTANQQADIMSNVYDAIYNDPNIKNFASVIELLKTYLPQIANVRNPYSDTHWTGWGEDEEEDQKRKNKNQEYVIQSPYAAKPEPSIANPVWGLPGSMWDLPQVRAPKLVNDMDKAVKKQRGILTLGTSEYMQTHSENFSHLTPTNRNNLTNKLTNGGGSGGRSGTGGIDQSKYKSNYDRSAARPTQVNINIDKLANFDRTSIAKNADERVIAEAIEAKIAEAVAMISAQALNSASSLIAQGV